MKKALVLLVAAALVIGLITPKELGAEDLEQTSETQPNYSRVMFRGNWSYVREGTIFGDESNLFNRETNNNILPICLSRVLRSNIREVTFHKDENVNVYINGNRIRFTGQQPYRVVNPRGSTAGLGWNRTRHMVPFHQFIGLFYMSDAFFISGAAKSSCGPYQAETISFRFYDSRFCLFGYSGSIHNASNYINTEVRSGLGDAISRIDSRTYKGLDRSATREELTYFRENIRNPLLYNTNLKYIKKLFNMFSFQGNYFSTLTVLENRLEIMVPLEMFKAMHTCFPLYITAEGNNIFIEVDENLVRRIPVDIPRVYHRRSDTFPSSIREQRYNVERAFRNHLSVDCIMNLSC